MEELMDETGLDGMFGTLLAVHGVYGCRILFHGPDGCRKYFGNATSNFNQDIPEVFDPDDRDPRNIRIFGTSMDCSDYLSDSLIKVRTTLESIRKLTSDPVVIIPSPGTLLLGIDYESIGDEFGDVFAVSGSYESKSFEQAFDDTIVDVMRRELPRTSGTVPKTVNVLGLSPSTRCKGTVIREIRELLGRVGVEVICFVGADTLDNMRRSVDASLNIVVSPEFCRKTVEHYKDEYGIPSVGLDDVGPVGFDAVSEFYQRICTALDVDVSPITEAIHAAERRAYNCVRRIHDTDEIAALTYSAYGDYSIVRPLVDWLYDSFGMVPSSVNINQVPIGADILGWLSRIGCPDVLGKECGTTALTVSDRFYGKVQSYSNRGYIGLNGLVSNQFDVMERTVFGLAGCMYILDTLLNIL